jgi:hypothetical protein
MLRLIASLGPRPTLGRDRASLPAAMPADRLQGGVPAQLCRLAPVAAASAPRGRRGGRRPQDRVRIGQATRLPARIGLVMLIGIAATIPAEPVATAGRGAA